MKIKYKIKIPVSQIFIEFDPLAKMLDIRTHIVLIS